MERKDLENLEIYQMSMNIGDKIWDIVNDWDSFATNTVGYQIVRAADSIAANISEGYGRYHFKENRQFVYIARGSLYETRTFLNKSFERKLIEEETYNKLKSEL
ncbi:MAG: four helix bundle protein [Bacteroidales bacterium]|nr:four helix bundle protein [Bacteroidales bacterium]